MLLIPLGTAHRPVMLSDMVLARVLGLLMEERVMPLGKVQVVFKHLWLPMVRALHILPCQAQLGKAPVRIMVKGIAQLAAKATLRQVVKVLDLTPPMALSDKHHLLQTPAVQVKVYQAPHQQRLTHLIHPIPAPVQELQRLSLPVAQMVTQIFLISNGPDTIPLLPERVITSRIHLTNRHPLPLALTLMLSSLLLRLIPSTLQASTLLQPVIQLECLLRRGHNDLFLALIPL